MVIPRAWAKHLYFTLLAAAGMEGRLLHRIGRQNPLIVLNLHRISPHPNPFWPPLSPVLFEELVVFLKRHFHVSTFSDRTPPDRQRPRAILSFDDGYYDFVEYAMPLLKKHGLPANQNIIPACVQSGRPPWTVQLSDFLNTAPRRLINDIRVEGFADRLRGEDPDHKLRYGLALTRFLKGRSRQACEPLWEALKAVMAKVDGGAHTTRMMSLEDVRQAAEEHEIGVHAFSHDSMAFETNEFFLEDLANCRAFFAQQLQMPMSIYAFPNSSYRPEQLALLRKAGVQHILLVEERLARWGEGVYPRLTIHGESGIETRFRALGYRARWAPCGSPS
ncbi:MAG: polysaccharide deacetylase family protein [Candidatus Omnitrophica bacterium]|nr:polysaccharide deacetylase family protein [Candidatus Omnitrophota bacterium]